jgi:acetylornithine deacetylase/succinyl-diaminopimelate desuccinylase-like protein
MRDEHGRVLIEGFYDHILPISEHDSQLLNEMPFDRDQVAKLIGYESLDMDGGTYYRKLTMEPTFNICGIHSGYTGEGTKTIIPSKATVKMDIRLVADQDPQDIFEKFCNHVKKVAPDIEVKFMGAVSPSRTSSEHELVQVVIEAVGEAHQQTPIIQPSMGGSLPDYMWTKTLGLPSIVVPYANFDEANHSPNENIGVDYFFNGIKSTCHVIHKLGAFHQSV